MNIYPSKLLEIENKRPINILPYIKNEAVKQSVRIIVEGEDLEMNLRFYMMVIPVKE